MANKTRDPVIELYRILLMFGICWLHCLCQGAWQGMWPRWVLSACVPGFVFISGYFGVKFSVSKTIRLYSVPIYASLLAPFLGGAFLHGCYWKEVIRVWHADGGFWFVHSYAILTIVAPLVNKFFEEISTWQDRRELIRVLLPIFFLVFGWGAALNYNHCKPYVPTSSGLSQGSFLTLLAIYSIGRMFNVFKLENRISWKCAGISVFLLFFFISIVGAPLSAVNNLVTVLLPVCLFVMIRSIKLPDIIARVVLMLSPFMFAVYCISGTVYFPFTKPMFFSVIEATKSWAVSFGTTPWTAAFIAAIFSFLLGIVCAVPQFAVASLLRPMLQKIYSHMDWKFERIVDRVVSCLDCRQ